MTKEKSVCFLKAQKQKKSLLLKFLDEASTISFQIIKKEKDEEKKPVPFQAKKVMNIKIPFFILDLYGKFYNVFLPDEI